MVSYCTVHYPIHTTSQIKKIPNVSFSHSWSHNAWIIIEPWRLICSQMLVIQSDGITMPHNWPILAFYATHCNRLHTAGLSFIVEQWGGSRNFFSIIIILLLIELLAYLSTQTPRIVAMALMPGQSHTDCYTPTSPTAFQWNSVSTAILRSRPRIRNWTWRLSSLPVSSERHRRGLKRRDDCSVSVDGCGVSACGGCSRLWIWLWIITGILIIYNIAPFFIDMKVIVSSLSVLLKCRRSLSHLNT